MNRTNTLSTLATVVITLGGCAEGVRDDGEISVSDGDSLETSALELAFPDESAGVEREGLFFVDGTPQRIAYQMQAGHAVHEGDIILGSATSLAPWELGDENTIPAAVKPDSLWPGGVVPYTLDGAGEAARKAFGEAVVHWEARTVLRFVPRTTEADYVAVVGGAGCSSYVGKVTSGGRQDLTLAEGCGTGAAIHEIGHAIGLWHEQSRADRDEHILVHLENVPADKHHNFKTYLQRGHAGEDIGAYDFDSIMHYGSYAFSSNGRPTLTRLDGSVIDSNREALSPTDLQGASALYGAPFPSCARALAKGAALHRGQNARSCDGRFSLVMQDDGNLVLYNSNSKALWHTHTYGTDAAYVVMQADGNLVLYSNDGEPVWHTHTYGKPGGELYLQNDGNLVVYMPDRTALWSSETAGE